MWVTGLDSSMASEICSERGKTGEWRLESSSCWLLLTLHSVHQVYVVLYSLLGAVQGMSYTYLSSVLTTIEKQFGIKSQEAAWIFSGNEISQIAFILVLPFLRRLNKRILWTSVALMVSSLGIFLCAIPYFLKVRQTETV